MDVQGVSVSAVAGNGVWVQEPSGGQYSGIWVFGGGGFDASTFAVGDVVDILGTYIEYYDLSEIDAGAGSVT